MRMQIEPVQRGVQRLLGSEMHQMSETSKAQKTTEYGEDSDCPAESGRPSLNEPRARVAALERALAGHARDLSLVRDAWTVHGLDLRRFESGASEHESALSALGAEVSELEAKTGAFQAGSGESWPEPATLLKKRLDELRTEMREAGERISRANAALGAKGRELLEL